MSRLEEVRRGRESAGLVRVEDDRCQTDETSGKGNGKGNGRKGEHGEMVGIRSKGTQRKGREAPNMGIGGSHPQATSDSGEEEKVEETEEEKKAEMGRLRQQRRKRRRRGKKGRGERRERDRARGYDGRETAVF